MIEYYTTDFCTFAKLKSHVWKLKLSAKVDVL